MAHDEFRREDPKPGAVLPARQTWARPTVTKLAAADAELGTRTTSNDGSFSVS
jgi:hypothetical protein